MKKFKNNIVPLSPAETAMSTKTVNAVAVAPPSREDQAMKIKASPAMTKATRVCLELIKPEAKRVSVAGSFNDWKPDVTPLSPTGNGRWSADLTIEPGRYEYLFVVDGQWLPDPNAEESVQNPYGGRNSVLGVSG